MTETARKELYRSAVAKFGQFQQIDSAIEEMSELTKELCKFKRGVDNRDAIVEEFADTIICLEQIKLMFMLNEEEVRNCMDYKLDRLEKRIHGKKDY